MLNKIFHKYLGLGYILHTQKHIGRPDQSQVVFLHGLASDSGVWKRVLDTLGNDTNYLTIDLLGFGQSPKPEWSRYDADQHIKSLYRTLKRNGSGQPSILVGHSMGALLAVEFARRYPTLVSRLVLCSVPIYNPNRKNPELKPGSYKSHYKLYETILKHQKFTLLMAERVKKYMGKTVSFSLDTSSWLPFKRSIKNTIMQQTTYETLMTTTLPVDIFAGKQDMLIMKSTLHEIEAKNPHVQLNEFNGGHDISKGYANRIATHLQVVNK